MLQAWPNLMLQTGGWGSRPGLGAGTETGLGGMLYPKEKPPKDSGAKYVLSRDVDGSLGQGF